MKDPAFLFYPNDFLSGTYTMEDEQIGRYIKLLCLQHQKGHLTEKDMLKICLRHDEDIFNKFQQDKDGLYFNKRLDEESLKRKAYSDSRRNNRLGHTKKTSSTYEKHMGNENININTYIDMFEKVSKEFNLSDEIKTVFLDWLQYKSEKRQSYKPTGMKALIKTKMAESNGDVKVLREMVDSSISNNYDGLFKPKKTWEKKTEQTNSSDTDQLLKDMRAKRGH